MRLACAAAFLLWPAASASASPVLVLDHGRVHTENDPFVPDTTVRALASVADAPTPGSNSTPPPPPGAVRAKLAQLLASGQISQATHDAKLAVWENALAARNRLGGVLRAGQTNAIGTVGWLAQRGQLTASRLNLAFTQLERNTVWWTRARRVPAPGSRVRVGHSRVLLEYVPGDALQFHALANWGRAQALLRHGYAGQGLAMVNELLALGSMRGSALTWEYLFRFGRGLPPWTSGLSQGTALVALSAAFRRTHDGRYADAIRQALRLYDLPAPLGVRAPSRWGAYYAEYSFAPRYRVINGFVQALNGLWDAWHSLGDAHAAALFAAGDRDARRSLPGFDIGHWSRYSNRGEISDVNYHVLLRDFLAGLCRRTRVAIYCAKAARFSYYLRRYAGPGRLPPGTHLV
ncbi:MAG: D-glucuronyl C5-epimerase family protein [Solirubrobacteraceae bacterium]|jgi:hypothetical protein